MSRIRSALLTVGTLSLVMTLCLACKQNAKGTSDKKPGGAADASPSPSPSPNASAGPDAASTTQDSKPATFFFTVKDIKGSTNLEQLDSDQVKVRINEDSTFFSKEPESDDSEGCVNSAIDKHQLTLSGDTLSVSFDEDLKTCMKGELETNDTKATVTEARLRFAFSYECAGGDLATWNGKSVSGIGDSDDPCEAATSDVKSRFNFHYKLKASITVAGETKKMSYDIKSVQGGVDSDECVTTVASGAFTSNGCVSVTSQVDASDDSPGSQYSRTESQKLVYKPQDKYYRSGKMKVEFNGWKGDMTYTGATAAPKFSVTKGTDTAKGTFVYQPYDEGVNLTKERVDSARPSLVPKRWGGGVGR